MGRLVFLLGVLALAIPDAPAAPDLAVVTALKQVDRSLTEVRIWKRTSVTSQLDLALAMGTSEEGSFDETLGPWLQWDKEQKLGIFLQQRDSSNRVFQLAVTPGPACVARILRATVSDTVISCYDGRSSAAASNQKFVYDVRAKRLVSQFAYEPLAMYRAGRGPARSTAGRARLGRQLQPALDT